MKKFESIESWIKSSPSKEEKEKVLNLINKQAIRELRFEIMGKEGILKKIEKTYDFMTEQGFKLDQSFKLRKKELELEIISLRKSLPIPKPKKVEETKIEETPVNI